MERKRFLKLFSSVLLVLVLVALSLGIYPKPAKAVKPINIGYSIGLTGPAAVEFSRSKKVVEMVVAEVNASGGIEGRPVKLFIADDGSDIARAMANVKRFRQLNNCTALIVNNISSVNLAIKAWAEEAHIPVICSNAMSDKLTQKEGKSWWFRITAPNRPSIEAPLLRAKKLGYTKIGFEGSVLAWGSDALRIVKECAPKYGLKLVGHVLAEPKSKDLTIQAMQLRDTGAEIVIQAEYAAAAVVWARALKDIGWKVRVINAAGRQLSDAVATSTPGLFEGTFEGTSQADPTKPLCIKVWDKFEKYTGTRSETDDVPLAWDGVHLLLEAIRLSGNPDDPEAIHDALYKIKDFQLASGGKKTVGSFEIGRNNILKVEDLVIVVVKSGKMQPVD